METKEYIIEVERRLEKIKSSLITKGREYHRDNNPFHNFEKGAKRKNINPTRVLDGFLEKHLISYDDMLNDIDNGKVINPEVVSEKIGDAINYLIIQEILIKEKFTTPF